MKIVTSSQMGQIETRSQKAAVSTDMLMEQAGLAVARRVRHHLGHLVGVPILVLIGPGNNGGDGLVSARHLHNWRARVLVYLCLRRREPDPKLAALRDMGLSILDGSRDQDHAQLRKHLGEAHMVVDAVLGTGRARPLEGALKEVFLELAEAKATRRDLLVLALDLPTGLDADTGAVDALCPTADITVALGYPKVGLLTFPGADKVGSLEVVDIGIPAGLDGDVGLELMTPAWAARLLPSRSSEAHKGTFGRTLVVAGSHRYVGAAYLASTAAYRVGAGLVTLAIPHSLQLAVASKAAEPTYLPLPGSAPGVVSPEAIHLILESLPQYDALLVGCGIGQERDTRTVVTRLLCSDAPLPPTVVDADGLNILSMDRHWWERFSSPAIVTPHPGEMARLRGESAAATQADRLGKAVESAAKWGKVTVLKGAHTVVAFPDGRAMLSPFANPALASAGTGDVLSGTIAGLLSQGLTLEEAAALGVYLHGEAGQRVREKLGDTGAIAGDLLTMLPHAIDELRGLA